MDNDLEVKGAFDEVYATMSGLDIHSLKQPDAAGIIRSLKKIDEVLQVIF